MRIIINRRRRDGILLSTHVRRFADGGSDAARHFVVPLTTLQLILQTPFENTVGNKGGVTFY